MKALVAVLLALCLAALTVQAESIATIELQNRPADEIIPLVKPMLGPGDAITGQGFQLFLRAPPDTQAQAPVALLVDGLAVGRNMFGRTGFDTHAGAGSGRTGGLAGMIAPDNV